MLGLNRQEEHGGEAEDGDAFKEYDDDLATEHKCPKCGYEW